MKKMLFTLAMAGLAILLNSGAMAATIYVDQSGGGTYTKIQDAINAAAANDVIMVGPGTYNEAISIDKSVSLIGSGPQYTIIDSKISSLPNANAVTLNISFPVIKGFTITSNHSGIIVNTAGVVGMIKNCIITGCSTGIYASEKASCDIKIVNNTIVSNTSNGIYFHNSGAISVKGNIIAYNGGFGIYSRYTGYSSTYNNLFENTGGNYAYISAGVGDTLPDPQFIDPETGNFVLKSSSQCINTGVLDPTFNDPDGTRNDKGVYGGPDSVSFWPYVVGGPGVTELLITPTSVPKGGKITIKAKGIVN